MENIKEFRKLVKSLPPGQRARLPEKIRELCNRYEHGDYLKAILIGAYLDLDHEISLMGYVRVPTDVSPDGQYCTAILDEKEGKMIIGEGKIEIEMDFEEFMKKVLYA